MSLGPRLPLPAWSIVLGLGDRAEGELDRTRRLQAEDLARVRTSALIIHLLVGLMVVMMMAPLAPAAPLAAWYGLIVAVAAVNLHDINRAAPPEWTTPRALLKRSTGNATVLGLLWIAPHAFFSRWAGPSELVALGILVPGMMAGAAMILAAAPTASLAFIVTVGLGGAIMLEMLGSAELAGIVVVATALLALTAMRHSRALMQRRGLELVLAEKDALVGLLLREFEDGADWLWRTDAARTLIAVGPRLARRLRRPAEALEGRPALDVFAGDAVAGKMPAPLRDLAERLHRHESFAELELPIEIAGEHRWWSLAAVPRHDESGVFLGYQGMASDITDRRRSTDRIERMARYDALTGLANRRHVLETLSDALVAAHRGDGQAALLIVDLDRFKQVNDTLGHPVGDRLLGLVAERLAELCGDRAMPGRLGGDEFALVVRDGTDREELEALATAIIVGLSRPYSVDEHVLHIGASIGSATAPLDGRSAEALVRHADLALYRAKEDGRGVHRSYEQRLSARAEERRGIEIALRDALEKDQLSLVYQPIVAAGDGRIEAFEAYLRWSHPELGEVPAERFVAIAEEARLMGRIGEWVIRTACHEAAGWPAPTRLSLNLSAAQLQDPHLAAILVSALSSSGLEPERLELEIAEGVLLRPGIQMQPVLDRLTAIGVRLALAHFGRGHAALAYLRGARFCSIKLDRSFTAGAGRDAADSVAMIRAVVAMADGLGMTVTAEGTETERQYELIRELGCGRAQGYLFGRPVPAPEARQLAGVKADRRAA